MRSGRLLPGGLGEFPCNGRHVTWWVAVRVDAAHLGLDPQLDFLVELLGRLARHRNDRPPRDGDQAWLLDEGLLGPAATGADGHRHDGRVVLQRQPGAARLVGLLLTGLRARAFREHDDPATVFVQLLAGALDDVFKGAPAMAAVDVHHVQHAYGPAEERDEQQLSLEDESCRTRHVAQQEEGFPGGLMLAQHDGRPVGQVLGADDPPAHAAQPAAHLQHQAWPAGSDGIAHLHRQEEAQHGGGGIDRDGDGHDQDEQHRADGGKHDRVLLTVATGRRLGSSAHADHPAVPGGCGAAPDPRRSPSPARRRHPRVPAAPPAPAGRR